MSEAPDDARIYPCDKCGTMRSKAEGGTVFTVCESCWDAHWRVAAGAGDPPGALNEAALDAAERAYWEDDGVSRHNMAAAIRAYLATADRVGAGDRPPAPSEAAKLAFLKAVSRIEEGLVLHDLWEQGLDAGLVAAYAVDFGAVRPTPRAAPPEERK